MGVVVPLFRKKNHADSSSRGYRSGLSRWRGTPDTRSTSSTRKGGTRSHCETACSEMPIGPAKPARPPTFSIASTSAGSLSLIKSELSTSFQKNQAHLHCVSKAMLYPVVMKMKDRLRQARVNAGIERSEAAEELGVSPQAINQWESGKTKPGRDNLHAAAKLYRIPETALHEDGPARLPPPAPDKKREFLDALQAYGKAVPEDQRDQVLKIISVFARKDADRAS